MLTFAQFISESPEATIIGFLRIAERPGTGPEGERAKETATRLAKKHGLDIEKLKLRALGTDKADAKQAGTLWRGAADPFAKDPEMEKKLRTGWREFKKSEQTLQKWGYEKTAYGWLPADKYAYSKDDLMVVVSFASGRWVAFDTKTGHAVKLGFGTTQKQLLKLQYRLNRTS